MSKETQSDPNEKAIVAALENSRYRWRTISGVIADTKLTRDDVLQGLAKLIDADVVIRSEVPSTSGEELYTTRDHYKRFSPITKRLSAALRNRAT